ncbi:Ig-like domain-containing protein [bacterium]|nr:Ig-like domain-containing protein [bacterium]
MSKYSRLPVQLIILSILVFSLFACKEEKDTVVSAKAPSVAAVYPADASTDVPKGVTMQVTFDESIDPRTVLVNTLDTTCSQTIQVSRDDFTTCLVMSSNVSATFPYTVYTIQPASDLSSSTTYKIRVTQAAKDLTGDFLSAAYTMATGFTTSSTPVATASLNVQSVSPAHGTTGASTDGLITAVFDASVDTATVTNSVSGTACSGSFQLSFDSFATCMPLKTIGTNSTDLKTWTWESQFKFDRLKNYQARLMTAIQSSAGGALPSDFTWNFTTRGYPALDLNGVDEYLTNGGNAPTNLGPVFSLAVWFTLAATDSDKRVLFWATAFENASAIGIFKNDSNRLEAQVHDEFSSGGGGTYDSQSSTDTLSGGTKYHAVITYTGGTLQLYLNGNIQSGTAVSNVTTEPTINNRQVYLGYSPSIDSPPFNTWAGKIHSAAIWDTAISAEAVTEIYGAGDPGQNLTMNKGNYTNAPNIKHWWILGEESTNLGRDFVTVGNTPIDVDTAAVKVDTTDLVEF